MTKTFFAAFILLLLFLSSCCTKEYCAELEKPIKLEGFTREETDTIYIVHMGHYRDTQYAQGSYLGTDTNEMILSETPRDYSSSAIIIPGANKTYSLYDAVYKMKKSCNKCFLKESPDYEDFVGCKVNGVYQDEGFTLIK